MIFLVIGFLSGVLSGMGVGGGMLLIPAARMFSDISQQAAQSLNLFSFIPSSLCALAVHIKNKKVDFKTAFPILLTGVPFSLLGAYISTRISSHLLSIFFGVFILFFGVREIIAGLREKKNEKSVKK